MCLIFVLIINTNHRWVAVKITHWSVGGKSCSYSNASVTFVSLQKDGQHPPLGYHQLYANHQSHHLMNHHQGASRVICNCNIWIRWILWNSAGLVKYFPTSSGGIFKSIWNKIDVKWNSLSYCVIFSPYNEITIVHTCSFFNTRSLHEYEHLISITYSKCTVPHHLVKLLWMSNRIYIS